MVIVENSRQHIWLLLLLLVLGSNLVLYRTDLGIEILESTNYGVVIGSFIDLVIIAPLLFLTWKKQKNVKVFVLLMATGIVLARFLIPMQYLEPFVVITWIGFGVEAALLLLELSLVVTLFRFMTKIIKSTKESKLPMIFAFPSAVDRYVKNHLLIHIICSELLIVYYAFASWRKKPLESKKTITLYKNSSYLAFQIMLLHAIVLETLGIHWWLHDKAFIVSILLLIFNIYSVILILANIQALRLNPLHIEESKFYISLGLTKRIEVGWDEIDEVITDKEQLEQKLSKDTIDFIARDFGEVFPNAILKLKEPKEAILLWGLKKPYQKLAIKLDDFQQFIEAIEKNKKLIRDE